MRMTPRQEVTAAAAKLAEARANLKGLKGDRVTLALKVAQAQKVFDSADAEYRREGGN